MTRSRAVRIGIGAVLLTAFAFVMAQDPRPSAARWLAPLLLVAATGVILVPLPGAMTDDRARTARIVAGVIVLAVNAGLSGIEDPPGYLRWVRLALFALGMFLVLWRQSRA